MLKKVVTKHPTLWTYLLREKRTVQEAEEAAVARIRKHWEDRGLGLFTRCGFTHKGWQTNINLSSHIWNKDLMDFERLLLPAGTPMCTHVSLDCIKAERNKLAEELGISSKADQTSTTFDIVKSLICRLEYLVSIRCAYSNKIM